jgi:hypothetical protein
MKRQLCMVMTAFICASLFLIGVRIPGSRANVHAMYVGLGSLNDGTDISLMRWGNTLSLHAGASCVSHFALSGQVAHLRHDSPTWCTPHCLAKGFGLRVDAPGVYYLLPYARACDEEAIRVRAARTVDESTQHLLRDTNVMYFDTHAV